MNKTTYLVIAYPELSDLNFTAIQEYRKKKDELYYRVVEPHFTLVFPVINTDEKDFIKEVKMQTDSVSTFNFTLRCATVTKDVFSE